LILPTIEQVVVKGEFDSSRAFVLVLALRS
jgi:hypothetical protein